MFKNSLIKKIISISLIIFFSLSAFLVFAQLEKANNTKTHVIEEKDTLGKLALRYYNKHERAKGAHWIHIYDYNIEKKLLSKRLSPIIKRGVNQFYVKIFTGNKLLIPYYDEYPSIPELFRKHGIVADKVTVWFKSSSNEARFNALKKAIDKFNASQGGIIVETANPPEGGWNEMVLESAKNGELPDILDFDGPYVYSYAEKGYLAPLDKYINKQMKNDFLESIIQQGMYKGKLYCLGSYDSGLGIWANKSLLEKADIRIPKGLNDAWTKEEFVSALEKLKALEEVDRPLTIQLHYGKGEWYTYGFSPIIQSYGGDLINRKDMKTVNGFLNSPESVQALKDIQKWIFEDEFIVPIDGNSSAFEEGSSALSYVGHWARNGYQEALGDDLILLPMPKFGDKAVVGMGSWAWAITTQGHKNVEASWEVLSAILQPEIVADMSKAFGGVPSRKSSLKMVDEYKEDGKLSIFAEQLQKIAIPRPQTAHYPTISEVFAEAFYNICTDSEINVKEELDEAVEKIENVTK